MATASIKRIPFDSKTSTAACRMSPPQEQDNSDSPSNTSELTTGKAEESDSRQRATKRQSLRIKTHEAPTKPKRKRISQEQFQALSELFEQTDTPNYELREKLAHKLNMTNREVQVWFQNRRAKVNRALKQRNEQLQKQQQQQEQQQRQWVEASPPSAYTSHQLRDGNPFIHRHEQQQQQQQNNNPVPLLPHHQEPLQRRWPTADHHHPDLKPTRLSRLSLGGYHYTRHDPQEPSPCDSLASFSSNASLSSSSSSSASTPSSPYYPALSPGMAPLEILAMAADYVQRCDQEQEELEHVTKRHRLSEDMVAPSPLVHQNTQKSWRPWL